MKLSSALQQSWSPSLARSSSFEFSSTVPCSASSASFRRQWPTLARCSHFWGHSSPHSANLSPTCLFFWHQLYANSDSSLSCVYYSSPSGPSSAQYSHTKSYFLRLLVVYTECLLGLSWTFEKSRRDLTLSSMGSACPWKCQACLKLTRLSLSGCSWSRSWTSSSLRIWSLAASTLGSCFHCLLSSVVIWSLHQPMLTSNCWIGWIEKLVADETTFGSCSVGLYPAICSWRRRRKGARQRPWGRE